jgi:hypothetical protein
VLATGARNVVALGPQSGDAFKALHFVNGAGDALLVQKLVYRATNELAFGNGSPPAGGFQTCLLGLRQVNLGACKVVRGLHGVQNIHHFTKWHKP